MKNKAEKLTEANETKKMVELNKEQAQSIYGGGWTYVLVDGKIKIVKFNT